jgi:hypothetical protein
MPGLQTLGSLDLLPRRSTLFFALDNAFRFIDRMTNLTSPDLLWGGRYGPRWGRWG